MNAAPAFHLPRLATTIGLGLAAAAGAALLWGAVALQDPGLRPAPTMAERPVILPDGTALYVQEYEVTVAEWNACHEAGSCPHALRPMPGQGADATPATGISHADAGAFLAWINAATGHDFRLPSAAEWQAMAAPVLPDAPDPIFTDPLLSWASAYLIEGNTPRTLKPKGSFSRTAEGIADLDGSVWEWTQDCYAGTNEGIDPERCPAYWAAGEHISAISYLVRDPARGGCAVGAPPAHLGLRLVTDAPPSGHGAGKFWRLLQPV